MGTGRPYGVAWICASKIAGASLCSPWKEVRICLPIPFRLPSSSILPFPLSKAPTLAERGGAACLLIPVALLSWCCSLHQPSTFCTDANMPQQRWADANHMRSRVQLRLHPKIMMSVKFIPAILRLKMQSLKCVCFEGKEIQNFL